MSSLYKRKDSPYYWWSSNYKGKVKALSTKQRNKKKARKVQEHWDLNLVLGDLTFLGIGVKDNYPITEYIIEYLMFVRNRKTNKAYLTAKGILKKFETYLKSNEIIYVDKINVKAINGYLDSLTKEVKVEGRYQIEPLAPYTKKNHLNEISLMLQQAIKDDCISNNPAKDATLPTLTKSGRHRLLDEIDLEIIFSNGGKYTFFYEFLYLTGLRSGDASSLKYEDINWKKQILTVYIKKSDKTYELPLAQRIMAQLDRSKSGEEPIFPIIYSTNYWTMDNNKTNAREHLKDVLKAYDRPPLATLHSFRHTFNNTLRNLGLQIEDRNVLMSHASSEVNIIYTHPNMELARDWVNKLPIYQNKKG